MKNQKTKEVNKKELLQELMNLVFKEAKRDSKKNTGGGLSKYLSEQMEEKFNLIIDKKTFNRYYEGYISKVIEKIEPQDDTLNALCKYLGYTDFKDFEVKRKEENKNEKLKRRLKFCYVFSIILAGLLSLFILKYYKKNCILWVDDHFEKIRCSGLENEEILDEIRLEKFRKVPVCKDTIFFKDGKPIKWYDRKDNVFTYFTYLGKNPESGRTVKAITQRIIDSRVRPCDSIK